ncbi:MAG: NAD(P)H-dependent oxidoreductase [Oscillospiraceae bacterium]|jgi:flavodoxin|nr:NAD(P)H-dependent oxidoreductase [Oscillospiraceae bacterium]
MKTLVAYFSASGVTAKAAKTLAEAAGADLFEIVPETPYTKADLNWMDKKSRSTLEMKDRACRPGIASSVTDMAQYQRVFVGFPVWWYREPSIIDTFLERYDFSGKTLIPFCTSGGSDLGESAENFRALAPGAEVLEGKRLTHRDSSVSLKAWIETL